MDTPIRDAWLRLSRAPTLARSTKPAFAATVNAFHLLAASRNRSGPAGKSGAVRTSLQNKACPVLGMRPIIPFCKACLAS
eukprot:1008221-Lingulodinium_polyedra.AAC.1